MRLDLLFKARLTGSLRQPFSLVFVFLAVVVSVTAGAMHAEKNAVVPLVALVDEDGGAFSEKLIRLLEDYDSFSAREMTYDDALLRLKQDRLEAAVIIHKGFSEKIARSEFEETLTLLTSPASQAPATVSEPVVNSVMMLWMEQLSCKTTRTYLEQHGLTYDAIDEKAQRENIQALWKTGSALTVERVTLDNPAPAGAEAAGGALGACVKWFGVLCLFYLVVGASWALDISKRPLRVRMAQSGARLWQVILVSSLAPLVICYAGFIFSGLACSLITEAPASGLIQYLLPFFLYLWGLMGMTLLTASLLKNVLSLMFIAPVLTFLSGILSGLIVALPNWANVLRQLSGVLPGRWLGLAISSPLGFLPQALLCAALWLCAGIAASALRAMRKTAV